MSGTHHHTWQKFHVGHLIISVELDSTTETGKFERCQTQAAISRQLIGAMDAAGIPATWAVSDPAHSVFTSLVMKSAVGHELAILADANWVGPTAGRTRFARELARRISQARAAGLQITSLVPNVTSIESQIDLVVKQHITAVAGFRPGLRATAAWKPSALHYGVWELPVSATLPMKSRWIWSGRRAMWKSIRTAAENADGFHLMIDAAAIAASGVREETAFRWLIRNVAMLRDRGLVRIETLRSTAARLSNVPAVAPQRSILRAA